MQLRARALRHSFGRNGKTSPAALDIPELDAAPRTLTVFTGPSGSGKTTLLYVLSGILRPTHGAVVWGETDLARLNEGGRDKWRRANAGFVFQDFNLLPNMSALANVTVATTFGGAGKPDSERAATLLRDFGISDQRRNVETFSRGEQQRIALARALLFDPPVLFADEPTASLDAENATTVGGHLANVAKAGKTVIAVSHDPNLIGKADRVVRLGQGRIETGQVAA